MKLLMTSLLLGTLLHAQNIYATFTVEASQNSELTLSATGIVHKLTVDVGSKVKKGELLLALDNAAFIEEINLARQEVALAQTQQNFAKKTYERYLQVKDVIDADQSDMYTLNYEKSVHALNRAKAALTLKKELLKQRSLYAPYDGTITHRHVQRGDGVSSAMMKSLLTLSNTKNVKLILEFDEKYWQDVHIGSEFIYHVDGVDKARHARITKVYPTANAKTHKIKAEVNVSNVIPGLFGDGNIVVNTQDERH